MKCPGAVAAAAVLAAMLFLSAFACIVEALPAVDINVGLDKSAANSTGPLVPNARKLLMRDRDDIPPNPDDESTPRPDPGAPFRINFHVTYFQTTYCVDGAYGSTSDKWEKGDCPMDARAHIRYMYPFISGVEMAKSTSTFMIERNMGQYEGDANILNPWSASQLYYTNSWAGKSIWFKVDVWDDDSSSRDDPITVTTQAGCNKLLIEIPPDRTTYKVYEGCGSVFPDARALGNSIRVGPTREHMLSLPYTRRYEAAQLHFVVSKS